VFDVTVPEKVRQVHDACAGDTCCVTYGMSPCPDLFVVRAVGQIALDVLAEKGESVLVCSFNRLVEEK
jgi:hypothetical protein